MKTWRNELRALRHLLHFLRSCDVCSVAPVETLPADEVVAAFERYPQRERGLAAGTIRYYRSFSRQFLAERFGKRPVDFSALRAIDVIDFVQRQATCMAPRALKLVVTALLGRLPSLCPVSRRGRPPLGCSRSSSSGLVDDAITSQSHLSRPCASGHR